MGPTTAPLFATKGVVELGRVPSIDGKAKLAAPVEQVNLGKSKIAS
jgi:hypothetical protein